MTRILVLTFATIVFACALHAQPLISPYTFGFDNVVEIDTALVSGLIEPAGFHGRVKLDPQGHLQFADGTRYRVVGTNLQWSACFPDSATAVTMARRFRSLGINTVRFTTIDVTWWKGGSIFADGTTTGQLDPNQMRILDWFVYQLKLNGVYSSFAFHSVWRPRPDDGVLDPDSLGWGSRTPLMFEPQVQRIHRAIMKAFLNHVNVFTNVAYKDEPAVPFIVVAEDAAFSAYWLYTSDIVRPTYFGGNILAPSSTGYAHVRYIDSLYNAYLRGKGLTTDAQLNARWAQPPTSPANQLQNAGFEDPFSPVWTLGVNSGAQAVAQFSDLDKKEGTQSMRVRINKLDAARSANGIYLLQVATNLKRLQRYTLSFWAKTTPEQGSRSLTAYAYNSVFPYESYGLAQNLTIDTQWKQYTYSFTCSGGDASTGTLLFGMGSDLGDVFLDDVRLTETGFLGVYPGETVANNSIVRATYWTDALSPNRSKDEAAFYLDKLETMFKNARTMIRDTVKSEVLLCPSTRMYSFIDLYAARDYDIFSATDWRSMPASMLAEQYGGSLTPLSYMRPAGKAMILLQTAIMHQTPYQSEMGVTLPAYMGLQDWDGVFFGVFSSAASAGRLSADSAAAWEILDKPNVLAMLPSVSRAMQEGVVKPSLREIIITNTRESLEYPRLHLHQLYSLSTGTDTRIPAFRRISISLVPGPVESVFPHLEVSALAGTVDLANLNAENEQIFWDASVDAKRVPKALLKVQTDRYVAVTGPIANQLIQMPGLILEETSQAKHTSVVINSLTELPLFKTPTAFLTISTRMFNEGTMFNATTGAVTKNGIGPTQMEGSIVRITYTAPDFDTMYVQPLGADAQPRGNRILATRNSTGKFSVTVNTQQNATPWYRMELRQVPNSVDDVITERPLIIAPNPASDEATIYYGENVQRIEVMSVSGALVMSISVDAGTSSRLSLDGLASGVYRVRVTSSHGVRETALNVIR
ncbi:MAG: T9SS type A sorting domain-containing protein [bacterium]|nr:T9SS type A sorting domain-containing protein [bacterium]